MTLTPGIRTHDAWLEADTRIVSEEHLQGARDYSSELCAKEFTVADGITILICLREKADPRCETGKHGYHRALEHARVDVGESLTRSLQQEADL